MTTYRNLWLYIDLDTDLFLTQESHCWWWRYLVWRCSSVTRWFPSPSSGKHSWRRTTVATVGQCTIASSPWSTTGSSIRLTRYGISDEIHIFAELHCTFCRLSKEVLQDFCEKRSMQFWIIVHVHVLKTKNPNKILCWPWTNSHNVPFLNVAMKRHNLTCITLGGEN